MVELADERAAVWMEDVDQDPSPWDLDRFTRAARLLGRWNARSSAPEVLAACPLPPGYALRKYVEQSVAARGLGPLADDGLWAHPWLGEHADLRARLRELARGSPGGSTASTPSPRPCRTGTRAPRTC